MSPKTNMPAYVKEKLKLLQKHFLCTLTEEEINKLTSAKSEISVDNIARTILRVRLGYL